MTSRDFCFWLKGFFEVSGGPRSIDQEQMGIIARHLSLVFKNEIYAIHKPIVAGGRREDEVLT